MLKTLTDKIKVGPITLQNRLVMPPMATEKSANGEVTEVLCQYYIERAMGGHVGLIETEHMFILPNGQASPHQVSIAKDSDVEGLKKLASAIQTDGTKAIAQINHAGSCNMESIAAEAWAPSAIVSPRRDIQSRYANREAIVPKEMTQDDIDTLIEAFAASAHRAKVAGFDGVEIHSAHGYLLGEFYSPLTNKRTDAYTGATLVGRTRLHVEIIKAVRAAVGADYLVALRFGAVDDILGGADITEAPAAAKIFEDAGIDMLSISGNTSGYIRPNNTEEGWYADVSQTIKEVVKIPVLLTGGIKTRAVADQLLNEDKADLIGIGRMLLSKADYSEILTK